MTSTETPESPNETPKSSESVETTEAETTEAAATEDSRPESSVDRRAIAIAGALVAACAGLVLYGVLDTDDKPKRKVPTAAVTYEVTGSGTAEISYQARSESGEATVATGVTLPWKKTVEVPLGKSPTVSIVLGEKGGEASCTLAIRGRHVQRATAFGTFGRATCQSELPAPETAQ